MRSARSFKRATTSSEAFLVDRATGMVAAFGRRNGFSLPPFGYTMKTTGRQSPAGPLRSRFAGANAGRDA